jgi:hypothetical protein
MNRVKPFIPLILAGLAVSVYITDVMLPLQRFDLLQNEAFEFILILVLLFYLPFQAELRKAHLFLGAMFITFILLTTVKHQFINTFLSGLHLVCYVWLFIILLIIKTTETRTEKTSS